jgi:hypothetical protein
LADETSELRTADAELRRDLSAVREQVRGMSVALSHKADREELHLFKEAIFDRLETLVSRVVVDHEKASVERMKVFGHENAEVIRIEVDRAFRERDRMEEAAKEKARNSAAAEAPKSPAGLSPKQTAYIAFASLAFGLALSEYAIPLLTRFAVHALTGG